MLRPLNLLEELDHVTEYWSPRIVASVNDQYVKVSKLKGSLVWHKHDDEDDAGDETVAEDGADPED